MASQGHNLIGKSEGSSGWVASDRAGNVQFPLDPLLGPLQDNGGPTLTMALAPSSAAVDAGDDAVVNFPMNLSTDQRGLPRWSGAHVDIGAFEVQQCVGGVFVVVNVAGHGTVQKSPDQSCYATGGLVTLTAIPEPGWGFADWSGDASGTSNPLTITLNTNKFVTARFESVLQIVVTTTSDAGPGSLRQALQDNHALGGGHTLVFADTVRGTITLTSGELVIAKDVTIVGPGADVLAVSGNNTNRVFEITGGVVTLNGLTIANGNAGQNFGGGIRNSGTLVLNNCVVRDNTSVGIYSRDGPFRALGSGFVYNGTGAIVAMALQLTNCTISGNAGDFAAISFQPGAIWNTTIAANAGGGFAGWASIGNSIIAGNGSFDAEGGFTSAGYNLIGRTNAASGFGAVGDQVGTSDNPIDPQLRPLGNYGGPTPTMPPRPGSPAIDQGKNFGQTTDQRGLPRTADHSGIPNATLGDGTDIGAAETGLSMHLLVTTTNDSGTGSLRNALQTASAFENTVTFAPHVTNAITLSSGQLLIDRSVEIIGPGAKSLAISGNNFSRVFQISGGPVRLSGLTIAYGQAVEGAGLLVERGELTLSGCHVVSNAAAGLFGGVGGGIGVQNDAVVTIENSAITANQAPWVGGGMLHRGTGLVTLRNSTVSGNRLTEAPGMISPNGAGITLTAGQLDVLGCTIAGNVSTYIGGGLYNYGGAPGILNLRNTIVAGNTGQFGPDVAGAFNSGGYNFIGKADDSTGFTHGVNADQVGSSAAPLDPLLGALGDYGGPTPTHALQFDSPAIDKGKSFGLATDQRGWLRTVDDPAAANATGGDGTEIGAFEVDPQCRIVEWRRQGDNVVLCLMTVLGRHYRGEYTNELLTGFWPSFTNNVPGTGHRLWITNFGGANQPQRFYRAAMLP